MQYVIILFAILAIAIFIFVKSTGFGNKKEKEDVILKFIQEHPEHSSVLILHNGEALGDVQADRLMPLASTVKIIIAIEYAKQAAAGKIQPNETVELSALDRFYLKNLDGDAHPEWKKYMGQKHRIVDGSVTLEEVAKGMIQFSSNANTEYLMEKLGLDNINRNLGELGLTRHEPLYPFVSSILIPYELFGQYPDIPQKEAVNKAKAILSKMSPEDFRQRAFDIHLKLRNDSDGSYKRSARIQKWYDSDFDKINSERFISSTAREYVSIMQKINSGSFFDPAVQKHLKAVLEGLMEIPANQKWLKHAGRKGGSTAYVLTEAMYATDKQGNTTEIAIFFNRLKQADVARLSSEINTFELKVLRDSAFRQTLKTTLDLTSG